VPRCHCHRTALLFEPDFSHVSLRHLLGATTSRSTRKTTSRRQSCHHQPPTNIHDMYVTLASAVAVVGGYCETVRKVPPPLDSPPVSNLSMIQFFCSLLITVKRSVKSLPPPCVKSGGKRPHDTGAAASHVTPLSLTHITAQLSTAAAAAARRVRLGRLYTGTSWQVATVSCAR
jgi:hypothetical protein